ncbi:MAG: sensor domain-containing protein [Micrococcales bacterium]|nr:sensor domain-containing protein [Micrococcales bacterium]
MSSTIVTRDDVSVVAPALCSARGLLRAPVSLATWRAFGQAVIAWVWLLPVGIAAVTAVSVGVATSLVAGIGLALLIATVWVAHWFAVVEAARLTAQTGVDVAAAPRRRRLGTGFWRAAVTPLADGRAWAVLGYAVVGLVISSVALAVLVTSAAGALAGLAAPVYLYSAPLRCTATFVGGVVLVWVVAVVAQSSALVQVVLARALLSQSQTAQARDAQRAAEAARRGAETARRDAEVRAAHLAQTRTDAVEAADDDRRRIERDLHDGAQQRLVALGVDLGVARRQAATDPAAAVAALDHAHAEVKETLAELRDLVRGIHPAVLSDRGLDAALSALAARSPVPVQVQVTDPDATAACGAGAQAAAYFVVAEALTNTAKHAHATCASVEVSCAQGHLRVVVTDDGVGGADTTAGTGLDGLRARVAALDGTFDLVSPPAGGTRLTVEVPCVS